MSATNVTNEGRKKLRQKMINLMYLIFIVLAFLYIPTDFIDTISHIDRSLRPSKKESDRTRLFAMEILKIPQKNDSVFTERNITEYKNFLALTDNVYAELDSVREKLIKGSAGLDAYGYVNKPAEFQMSENVFLGQQVANQLKHSLHHYRDEFKTMPCYIGDSLFNALINTDSLVVNGSGKSKTWEKFYFKKTPIGVSLALLSKFKSDVAKIEAQTTESFMERITNQYVLGIKAKKPIDEAELKRIDEMQKEMMNAKPTLTYPSIDKRDPEALYLGIKNPIRISHPRFKMSEMYAEISNGDIKGFKDSIFYATPNSTGPVEVKIYNRLGNAKGASLLISKRFIAREMPLPKAFLADRVSGSISTKIFTLQTALDLKHDDLRSSDTYFVKNYSVTRVAKSGTIQNSANNGGASFNSATRQLVDEAKAGDIYIFDNIKVTGPNGTISNIPSLVLTIL